MTVADYLVEYLIELGVTDVFGLPGGVILEFLYSVDEKAPTINAHLSYHEQGAGFAACGYAQSTGNLGVAYATRGPGITNMVTAIADAYYDSIPVLFITAHDSSELLQGIRIMNNQEMDVVSLVGSISKYATRIDVIEEATSKIKKACKLALSGRKGPVVLDFHINVLKSEFTEHIRKDENEDEQLYKTDNNYLDIVKSKLLKAKRPIILFGDGIRQGKAEEALKEFVEKNHIPALSSRFSQDIIAGSSLYFGYIGSRGLRYSNFILSKADLIIAIGNRMAYPIRSDSYISLMNKVTTIRIDIDASEFERKVPNCINVKADAYEILTEMNKNEFLYQCSSDWVDTCNMLKETLFKMDTNEAVEVISNILKRVKDDTTIISDVGNNEYWLSRAYALSKSHHKMFFSKSFGALGCAVPKAIGSSLSNGKQVLCFVGDQGIQINIQELMPILTNNLPIVIVVLNNYMSGMVRDRELSRYNKELHTTKKSGYHTLNLEKIADAYGLRYHLWNDLDESLPDAPCIIEVKITDSQWIPFLPKGNEIQDLEPSLDETIYQEMNRR